MSLFMLTGYGLAASVVYHLFPLRFRWVILLLLSYGFYASRALSGLPFILLTTLSTWLGALAIGLRGNDLSIVLLCAASSLATTAFPMAIARDSDYELTGQIVVTTSFLCCITLFVWIFVLKQLGLI